MIHWLMYLVYLATAVVSIAMLSNLIYKLIIKRKLTTLLLVLIVIGCFAVLFTRNEWFNLLWNTLLIFQIILVLYTFVYVLNVVIVRNGKSRKQKERPATNNDKLPTVSIVIAVYNEEGVLDATIKNLLKLNYDKNKLEIVFINDCSTDGTLNELNKYKNDIRIINRQETSLSGKPAAFNEVIPKLQSDLICAFDADSLPEEDFLLKIVSYFEDQKVGLVQARNIQYNEKNTLISRLVSLDIDALHMTLYNAQYKFGFTLFEGRAGVFRRKLFEECGGFDVDLPTEDWDFGYKLQLNGYKLIYDSDIHNYEQAVETMKEFIKQRKRWLGTTVMTFLKHMTSMVSSPNISTSGKLCAFFSFFFNLWSITFLILGFIGLIGLTGNYDFNENLFFASFLITVLLYNIVPIVSQKKWIAILYLPLMYIYYWAYSIIITQLLLDNFVLKEKPKFEKAIHSVYALKAAKRIHKHKD
jgi:cellulose synthase/poly-beta-1,6-N-acetylglucosamine synthase-like glycosyltransferase